MGLTWWGDRWGRFVRWLRRLAFWRHDKDPGLPLPNAPPVPDQWATFHANDKSAFERAWRRHNR